MGDTLDIAVGFAAALLVRDVVLFVATFFSARRQIRQKNNLAREQLRYLEDLLKSRKAEDESQAAE